MKKTNERELAIDTLMEIVGGAYNNIALRKALGKNSSMSQLQKSFVTELVNGSLRNLIYLDYIIGQFSKTPPEKMKPFILSTLRVSIYQIFFMDRVPASAVCNEAVELVKKRGFTGLSGFVNGVLRNIARQEIAPEPPKDDFRDYLSVKYSYPRWLTDYFYQEVDDVQAMYEANAKNPPVTICVNRNRTDADSLMKVLADEGMSAEISGYMQDALHVGKTADLARSSAFNSGLFHVMDESSMLAVKILDAKPGDTVIDVCAAPGGKSLYASYFVGNTGKVYANDIYEHKATLIRESAGRIGAENIEAGIQDARVFNERFEGIADAVIVDAPCSGFGLIRKKPDIKYTKTMDDINALARLQREILTVASRYVKKSGVLVYSTCTLSSRENLENVKWFIENHPFEPDDIAHYLPGNLKQLNKGSVQIMPGQTDGFFIAKLYRR